MGCGADEALVCCQPIELIWAFFCFINFPILPPPPPINFPIPETANYHRPLLRIPSLAIHLDRTVNDSFKANLQTQCAPILGMGDKGWADMD